MLNDYRMIVHKFDDEIDIIPIADVHLGAIEHNVDAWENFLLKIKNEPNTYFVLVGDLIQNNVKSSVGSPFDQVWRPMEQKAIMTKYLEPFKDRILCAVSGNHERRTSKEADQDLTYDIMTKLEIEDLYRENAAFMKINIGDRADRRSVKGRVPNVGYVFCVTHGSAGGRLTGNPINRAEEFSRSIEGLDCLIVGHSHKGAVTRPKRLVIDPHNNKVKPRSYLIVSAESWMNYGGYAAQKMLQPAEDSNPQRLHLRGSNDTKRIEVKW